LLFDKACDAPHLRQSLEVQGTVVVIRKPDPPNRRAYRRRNVIERMSAA
jgi:transposase